MKRWYKGALAIFFVFALIITGCGAKAAAPRAAVEGAFAKALELKSYGFETSIVIDDLQINAASATDPNAQMVMSMLKNAELKISGAVQQEPLQLEANLEVKLQGDMAMTFTLPLVMTEDKMWIKVPNIPMLPMPTEIVGKFIEFDLKQLAEESGEPMPTAADMKTMQNASNDLVKAVLGKFDEKAFFVNVDKKEAALPEGLDVNQVVKFNVNNENFDQFATTLVKEALPAAFDALNKDEYLKLFDLEKADIEEAKKEIATDENELKKGIAEIKETMKINELSLLTAINKDQYPTYQRAVVNLEFTEDGDKVKIAAKMTNQYTNINKPVEFKIGKPADAITMDQLEEMFAGY
ncbi:hypothetical protein WJ0W_004848 [Paenibacillus melissococcoides]|uniref:Lipoprotein n=1 Tax=Paenibacillus melissococcoides TaxID=2912268 RepID=A0ABM9G6U2_9BACL|nr:MULTISPECIES: DUF6612 family protein [Paenibacillus]MEB9893043.1 hypothetical protein [Bacillus cereus]CAH8247599.1 hypothetical protein WJ0W_004848 [Paenibacillus melissococcoides]CAH8705441.1 hypothetical protein HTL2_000931 [Paenibacillus melissococcoides]CAH8714877.1 hypothetical protein WDD9_004051 [Paenibacillus melissococcoides]GIO79658.1 hypothetical protein J6TS7_32680 [Paenibacillus dendritiformis]